MKAWCDKLVWAMMLMGICFLLGTFLYGWYQKPFLISTDCRGYQIDSIMLQQMREQEKDGYLGVLAIAGWRTEPNAMVTAPATGRGCITRVLAVDGPMDMVFPVDILSGSYGQAVGEEFCVLTKPLAYELFGNTSAGGLIWHEGNLLTVAGVIDKEEAWLLIPSEHGKIEELTICFQNRQRWKEKRDILIGTLKY